MAKHDYRFVLNPQKFYNVVMETSILVGPDQDFLFFEEGIQIFSLGINADKGIDNPYYLKRLYKILKHLNPEMTYDRYEYLCWVIAHPTNRNIAFMLDKNGSNKIAREAWECEKPLYTKKRRKIFFNESRGYTREEKIAITATLRSGGWYIPDGELIVEAMDSLQEKKIRISKETLANELCIEGKLIDKYYRQAGKLFRKDIVRRNAEMELDKGFDEIFKDMYSYWKRYRKVRKPSHYLRNFRIKNDDYTKKAYLKANRKLKLSPAYKKYHQRKEEMKYE